MTDRQRCVALDCERSALAVHAARVQQGERVYDDALALCEAHGDLLAVGFQLARAGRAYD